MPSPSPRRRDLVGAVPRARTAAVAAALALALGALAAACAPDPGTPGGAPHALPSAEEVEAALERSGATGPAVPVWMWTPEFVAGDAGAEPLAHTREWIAPTGPAASPTGTVTVWQDPAGDGSVAHAATSDAAELGAALATLGPQDVLVTDQSDWLVVTGDRVRPLLTPPRGDLTGPMTVAEYGRVLAARAAADGAHEGPGSDSVGGG